MKTVPWWDDPKTPAKADGMLNRVDCLAGSQARLTIVTDDHKTVKLLVADPSKLSIAGKGDLTFRCGVQKPRRVMVGYTPKLNARLATAGEAATLEFK